MRPSDLRGKAAVKLRTRLTVFAAHVDNESQGIADANWSSHSSSSGPVTVSDFHVALRRLQGEDYGISRGDPGRRWVRKRQEECVSVISRAVRPTSRRQDSTDVRHYRRYYVNASRETFHRARVIGGFGRWITPRSSRALWKRAPSLWSMWPLRPYPRGPISILAFRYSHYRHFIWKVKGSGTHSTSRKGNVTVFQKS